MHTPLNWISLYTPIDTLLAKKNITDIAHEYSIHTAEIDGIEEHRIDKVVIGKVLRCEKHPESKKLSICEVLIGAGETTVILTGAPNIATATYVPVALVGAVLGGNFTIGERMMAGYMSRGMICGADEIGLALESDGGIMVLEDIWERDILESMIGRSVFDLSLPFPGINGKVYAYTLGDTTFEIDNKFITNRPDLFGVYGNAREWWAVFDLPFESYIAKEVPTHKTPFPLSIQTDRCLSYNAIKMDTIQVSKSPLSLALMMQRAWLAEKMDLVDITNLILTEFGQPMHVFDADKIIGGITVRLASKGEKILALNGVEYELTGDDMVIADDRGPIAIAWVIGGMDSAVSDLTTNVIWESATFDAVSVRLTAQRHSIRTDASTRYEKSLDPLLAGFATSRILDYLKFLEKNINITATASYLNEEKVNHITIDVEYDFINKKAWTPIPETRVQGILQKLGFEYTLKKTGLSIVVPSWRASKDISIKEDMAEEVIRIYGYDHIEPTPLDANFSISTKNTTKDLRNICLDFWKHQNWNEAYNYSFSNTELDTKAWLVDMSDAIGIQNAYNVDYTHMRRSLSVRLFESIANNRNNEKQLRFFEMGNVYSRNPVYTNTVNELINTINPKPYGEVPMIAGATTDDDIASLRESTELFLNSVLGYLPPLRQTKNDASTLFHPGITWEYHVWDMTILRFGKVHPETTEAFNIPHDTLYWEADMRILQDGYLDREIRLQPISRFQSIPRELNFIMDESLHTGPLASMIEAHHPWIQGVIVDSIYRDKEKIWKKQKSVNFAFFLQSQEDTISDNQALEIQNDIIALMSSHGCQLRSL